jgi:hypothetical protein
MNRVLALLAAAALFVGCGPELVDGLGRAVFSRRDDADKRFGSEFDAYRVGRKHCTRREFPASGLVPIASPSDEPPDSPLHRALSRLDPATAALFAQETSRSFWWFYASREPNTPPDACPCQVWMDARTFRVWAVSAPR